MRISDWSSDVCSSDLLSVSLQSGCGFFRRHRGIGGCLCQRLGTDVDAAPLGGLRHTAHEVDAEQAVLQRTATLLHVVGKTERQLERALRNPMTQTLHGLRSFPPNATYRSQRLLDLNVAIAFRQ